MSSAGATESFAAAADESLELSRRLREAAGPELEQLVESRLDELSSGDARQALRNPHATRETVERLSSSERLLGSYRLRRDLAGHPRCPEPLALRFVPGLYWRDLARLAAEVRARPLVRRQAEVHLKNRLPGLALGERIALARIASGALIHELRRDGSPRVIRALLENPRLTEGHLLPLASRPATPAVVLGMLADDRRWGARYTIRCALARNRATPAATALGLLPGLRKTDLAAVANDRTLRTTVRKRARVLLGREL